MLFIEQYLNENKSRLTVDISKMANDLQRQYR